MSIEVLQDDSSIEHQRKLVAEALPELEEFIIIGKRYVGSGEKAISHHVLSDPMIWPTLLPISSWLTVRPQYRLSAVAKCSMTQFTNNHEQSNHLHNQRC